MKTIRLTHANLKVPIVCFPNKFFYLYTSAVHGCVHIVSDNGTVAPVAESEEQILSLINNNEPMEKKPDGTTK